MCKSLSSFSPAASLNIKRLIHFYLEHQMENSPGTWTVSMFVGCWLTGIASGSSLIISSLALHRCFTYLQRSAAAVQMSLSLSWSGVPPLDFVEPPEIQTSFLTSWYIIQLCIASGEGGYRIQVYFFWQQMACLGIPLFWVALQYLSGSSSTLIHWVTWQKSVRFACVVFNVCVGPRIWYFSLTFGDSCLNLCIKKVQEEI